MKKVVLFILLVLIILPSISVRAENNYDIIQFHKNELKEILTINKIIERIKLEILEWEKSIETEEVIIEIIEEPEIVIISDENEEILEIENVDVEEKDIIKETPKKVVYLTFDDGPSQNTVKILNTLREHDVKATFFVNGNSTDFGKSIYRRIVDEGHAIANHTYTHNYATQYKSIEAFLSDFDKLNSLLEDTIGIKPNIFRFPGGSNNTVSRKYGGKDIMKEIQDYIRENRPDLVYFDWNVDSGDASGKELSSNDIVNNVVNGTKTKNRAIILMHDSGAKKKTAEALNEVIIKLKELGYSFEILTNKVKPIQFQ